MNRNDLYRAMDGIDDEVLAEAESSAGVGVSRRKISGWRIAAAACVCLIAGFAAWRLLDRGGERPNVPNDNPLLSESGSTPENSKPDPAESRYSQKPGEYGFWNILPGGFLPELMVNGKLYYWDNFAYPLGSDLFEGVYIDATGKTVLPAGYAPTGQISSVTENSPTEDSQLKAGFSATGTIYTNEASPEAVYVLLDAVCFDGKGPYYIRFISDELAVGGRISWQGRDYLFRPGSDEFEVLQELPEGCEELGTLHFIGIDLLPEHDLETNCPNDDYSKSLEGRSVYAVPDDQEFLYLHETQYWAGGSFESYIKCPLLP